jgi:ADP-ribose pyrophosphatase YjhB (NUDIX family)
MNNKNEIEHITIRVYGILINEKNEVLLSDEFALGQRITKFPGGGLDLGEGTIDTLKREFIEEFNQEIEVLEHFYTTDFFQKAFTLNNFQLFSIYYLVKILGKNNLKLSEKPFDKENFEPGDQTIRFEKIEKLTTDSVTFPIDKVVMKKIKEKYKTPIKKTL